MPDRSLRRFQGACRALSGAIAVSAVSLSASFAQSPGAGGGDPEFERETIEDWVVECLPESDAKPDCQLYQRILTQDREIVAMVVTFAWSEAEGGYRAQIALPLGVLLGQPPLLEIDDDYKLQLAWSRCISEGCLIEGSVGPAMIDRLSSGNVASITVRHPTQGNLAIPIQLSGFSEAVARIRPQPSSN